MNSSFYRAGSITVTNGSPVVTSDQTTFLTQAKQGDILVAFDTIAVVDGVNSNNQLTLSDSWSGQSGTTGKYTIIHTGAEWHSTVTVNEKIVNLLARVEQLINKQTNANTLLQELTLSNASVSENTAAGTLVGTLGGQTAGSTFTLVNDAGGRFALSNGTIVTGATPTDYEVSPSHQITVRETLAGIGNSPRDTTFTVAVQDVAETGTGPTLAQLTLSANSLPEMSPQGYVVGYVQNRTTGSTLTLSNDAGGRFTISGTAIMAGSVPTDYETATSHQVTVRESLTGAANTPRDTVFTINVTDVVEGGTTTTLGALALSGTTVAENSVPGTVIGAIQGATAGSTITLFNDGGGLVAVSGSNLVVGPNPVNYETTPSFAITLRETLAGAANSPRDSAFTITVLNVLESTLNALTLSNASIPENSIPGTVIGALQAVTTGSVLTLTDNAGGKVAISSGNLVAGSTNIDYETTPSFTVTIRETNADATNSPKDTVLTVTVQNVAEGTGTSLGTLTINNNTIAENSAQGTPVGQIQGQTAGSSLSLVDSAGGRFALNGGTLVAGATNIDYEAATNYNVTIRETLAGATGSPKDTVLNILVVNVIEQAATASTTYATAATTGVPAGTTLTQFNGGPGFTYWSTAGTLVGWHTTQDGLILDGLVIPTTLYVDTNNVTIRNCKIQGGWHGVEDIKGVTGLWIHDCEFDGTVNGQGNGYSALHCCGTFERLWIHNFENGVSQHGWIHTITRACLMNNFIVPGRPGGHKDGIEYYGDSGGPGYATGFAERNSIIQDDTDHPNGCAWAANTYGPTKDTTFQNNYFDGKGEAAYTLWYGSHTETLETNVVYKDNYVARGYWGYLQTYEGGLTDPLTYIGNVEVPTAVPIEQAPWIVNGVQQPQGSGGAAPTLAALSLTNAALPSGSPQGWVIGSVRQTTQGSTLTLTNDAGGRFALNGRQLVAGATPTNYATATGHTITIRETLSGATGSPKDTTLTVNVTQVAGGGGGTSPTLQPLTLTNASIAENSAAGTVIGSVQGLTAGSTLTLTDTGGGRAALANGQVQVGSTPIDFETTPSFTITLRETLTGATNTPRDSTLTINVIDVYEGTSSSAAFDNVWPTGTALPGNATTERSTGLVLGTDIAIQKGGYILGVTFPRTDATAPDSGTIGMYRVDDGSNTLVASKAYTGQGGTGVRAVRFDSPVQVTAGQVFRFCQLLKPDAGGSIYYRELDNVFASGAVVNSAYAALQARKGYYVYATAMTLPTSSFANACYFIDAIWSDTNPSTAFTTVYPSAQSAGVPAGVSLTARGTGAVNTITVDGTVWDAQDVNGPIQVNANNVTIKRSKVTGSQAAGVIVCPANYTGLKVEDCTLIGGATQTQAAGVQAGGLSIQRNDISGVQCGIRIDDGNEALVVAGNYIHGLAASGGGSTFLGIDMQAKRTSTTIKHNTVDMAGLTGGNAFRMTNTFGNNSGTLFEDNYVFGPSSTIFIDNSVTGGAAGTITGLTFNKNLIKEPGADATAPVFKFASITPTVTANMTVG